MVASECEPFAKTGGLADVVDALARALGRAGHEVDVYIPLYRGLVPPAGPLERTVLALPEPQPPAVAGVIGGDGSTIVELVTGQADGYRIRLVDHPFSFDRPDYYVEGGRDYPDNGARFSILGRACLETIRREGRRVHVLHGHDWEAAPAILSLGSRYAADPTVSPIATVLTAHNLAYHGWIAADRAWSLDLLPDAGYPEGVDLLREAVGRADVVTTVSPTFAAESRTAEYGSGTDDLLRALGDRYVGILNGIDRGLWDPATDSDLPRTFSAADPSNKAFDKIDLAGRLGVDLLAPPDREPRATWGPRGAPVFGMVGRLDPQKGFDMLAEAAGRLVTLGARLIVLGTGDHRLVEGLHRVAAERPGRIVVLDRFDRIEARRIYAGADVLLMPSRFEPCGQSQMIAMRYGTLPLVRRTGGLADTVVDADASPGNGTGFAFDEARPEALVDAARRTIAAYRDEPRWLELRARAMSMDFSWARAVPAYEAAYRRAIALRSGSGAPDS